jgi:hypothetical protein
VAREARGDPRSGWIFRNGAGQPINLTKFVERVIEPTLEAKAVAFKALYAGRRCFATILRELTGGSVAGRDALEHVSTATTKLTTRRPFLKPCIAQRRENHIKNV